LGYIFTPSANILAASWKLPSPNFFFPFETISFTLGSFSPKKASFIFWHFIKGIIMKTEAKIRNRKRKLCKNIQSIY
jgi:hypothetical protein